MRGPAENTSYQYEIPPRKRRRRELVDEGPPSKCQLPTWPQDAPVASPVRDLGDKPSVRLPKWLQQDTSPPPTRIYNLPAWMQDSPPPVYRPPRDDSPPWVPGPDLRALASLKQAYFTFCNRPSHRLTTDSTSKHFSLFSENGEDHTPSPDRPLPEQLQAQQDNPSRSSSSARLGDHPGDHPQYPLALLERLRELYRTVEQMTRQMRSEYHPTSQPPVPVVPTRATHPTSHLPHSHAQLNSVSASAAGMMRCVPLGSQPFSLSVGGSRTGALDPPVGCPALVVPTRAAPPGCHLDGRRCFSYTVHSYNPDVPVVPPSTRLQRWAHPAPTGGPSFASGPISRVLSTSHVELLRNTPDLSESQAAIPRFQSHNYIYELIGQLDNLQNTPAMPAEPRAFLRRSDGFQSTSPRQAALDMLTVAAQPLCQQSRNGAGVFRKTN